jgi:hypothetical protein
MLHTIRPAGLATAGRGKTKKGHAFGTHPSNSQNKQTVQAAIRAELTGSDNCAALGIVARGNQPVLRMCRLLVAAGVDPARPLDAFRGSVLALRVRSVGQAAHLRMRGDGIGFETLRCPTASPMRKSRPVLPQPPQTAAERDFEALRRKQEQRRLNWQKRAAASRSERGISRADKTAAKIAMDQQHYAQAMAEKRRAQDE